MTNPYPALDVVVGQEVAKTVLSAMLSRGDRPVVVIRGPRWIGRRTLARAFVRAANCRDGGCGKCDSCRLSLDDHPNVRLLAPEEGSSIGVDAVRQAISVATRKPWGAGGVNAVVVDDALAMTNEADSLLLKATEDRPPDCVYLLVTEDDARLSAPLRSRCMTVTCASVGEQGTVDVLTRMGAPAGVISQWAPVAGGRPGIAVALWKGGAVPIRESALAFLEAVGRPGYGAISEAFGLVDAALKGGHVRTFLDFTGLLLRDAVAISSGGSPANVDLTVRLKGLVDRGLDSAGALAAYREAASIVASIRSANAGLHLKRMVIDLRMGRRR